MQEPGLACKDLSLTMILIFPSWSSIVLWRSCQEIRIQKKKSMFSQRHLSCMKHLPYIICLGIKNQIIVVKLQWFGNNNRFSYWWLLDVWQISSLFSSSYGKLKFPKPRINQVSPSSPFLGQLSLSYPNDIIQAPMVYTGRLDCFSSVSENP